MVRLAREHGRPADLARWTEERDRIYAQIMERGWRRERRAFTQHDKTEVLDASLLDACPWSASCPHRPAVAVDPGRDGGRAGLRQPGVPLRPRRLPRRPAAATRGPSRSAPSGMWTRWPGPGRLEQARLTLEKMFTYANHLGLYAEEIGQTGEQLGNFPQAFTHLSLINAAINLDHQLDHGPGRDPLAAQ